MAKSDTSFTFHTTHEETAAKPCGLQRPFRFYNDEFFVKALDILISLYYCINNLVQ